MGGPTNVAAACTLAELIDPVLAAATAAPGKSGYIFTLHRCDSDASRRWLHGFPDLHDQHGACEHRPDRSAWFLHGPVGRDSLHDGAVRHQRLQARRFSNTAWRIGEGDQLLPAFLLGSESSKRPPCEQIMNSQSRSTASSKRRDSSSERKGFSLIELLIVVAIILIIAAIAIPNLPRANCGQ